MNELGKGVRRVLGLGVLGMVLVACGDLLTVDDPQRYTDEDLDDALDAVAAGVEGDFHTAIDSWVVSQALMSDEYRHTGTWGGYEDLDLGRIRYDDTPYASGAQNTLLEARWAAQDAQERFERVIGDGYETEAIHIQVKTVEGLTELIMGQDWCEAPRGPGEEAIPSDEVLQQAVDNLTEAEGLAEVAGEEEWRQTAVAARARAHLLLENFDQAAQDASEIPDDFVYYARFSTNTGRQNNWNVTVNTRGHNEQAGVAEPWQDLVDTEQHLLRDPWTDELDPRVPIQHEGQMGQNGFSPHFSQWKHQGQGDDIRLLHSGEMRLIEAEVLWRNDDLEGALDIMNDVREAAGLSELPGTNDPEEVRDYILHERFAETFMEGGRLTDLRRFGMVDEMHVERAENPGENIFGPDRPVMFPLSSSEGVNNPNIEDDRSERCLILASDV